MIIYTKDDCPYCVKAKNLAKYRGQEYTEVKIGIDITREEFLGLFPEARTVPQIVIDGVHIGGYTEYWDYT